ncbi:LuxR C-terminal-related transcriptional regulator [Pseudofrankia sp. EUN1h]|uniref:LuxR C-terminal-related transcriptional regulator n=1 Tax=Pseudofrankia sp. EUN1h TaxID=1834515 RepID=UPI0008DAB539|nr:LuxR C-terminal-related transcriptional regulator [Pseudofrankia sp. EUN1h]OHV38066.1 hypothetical protein BCD49_13780 [Pseudofrankia sp. EUN1h]
MGSARARDVRTGIAARPGHDGADAAGGGPPPRRGQLAPPTLPAPYLPRPRLWEILDQGSGRGLTVVRGPAGCGKTTLIASWYLARRDTLPIVWLRVDAGPPLWEHLLAALAGHPEAALDVERGGLRPPPPGAPVNRFWRDLVDVLSRGRPAPLVLAIDDVELVRDEADIAGLRLLATEATGIRLVLCGRRIPVATHRTRAAGQLTEIGPDQLAFDAEETGRLLAALRAPAAAGPGLLSVTEGWAAGLRLAAGVLVSRPAPAGSSGQAAGVRAAGTWPAATALGPAGARDHASAGLADGGRGRPGRPALPSAAFAPVAEYLRAEALAAMPAPVRPLLLRTSVLDQVCAPLAEAVVAEHGGGDRLLAELAAGDILATQLPLPPPPDLETAAPTEPADVTTAAPWFRYHQLLRGMLREALRRDPTEDEAELNLRAALWYAANRRLVDAARHARRAGDWRYLACLVARGTVPLVLQGDLPDLAALVTGYPDRAAGLGPECATVAALARVLTGDVVAAGEYLELARAGASVAAAAVPAGVAWAGPAGHEQAGDGAAATARRSLLMAIEAVELRRAELAGDADAMVAAARRALRARSVPPPGPAEGLPDGLRPLALCARGRAELWRGRLEAAEDALRTALAEARSTGLGGATASCLGALALGSALRGRLRLGEETAAAALAVMTGPRGVDPRGIEGGGLSRRDQDDLERLARLVGSPAPVGAVEALLALAVVAGYRGDVERGLAWVDQAVLAAGPGPAGQLPDLANVLRAWLHLGRRGADDLRAARRALGAVPTRGGPALLLALREATQADLLVVGGNPDAALRLLERDEAAGRRDGPAARLARGRAQLAQGDAAAAALTVAPLLRADGGGVVSVVGACAVSALAAARRGDGAAAGGLLARAFALAQDEPLVRPFLELGSEVVGLTEAHPSLSDAAPALVAALRARFAREPRRRPVEPAVGAGPGQAAAGVRPVAVPAARRAPGPAAGVPPVPAHRPEAAAHGEEWETRGTGGGDADRPSPLSAVPGSTAAPGAFAGPGAAPPPPAAGPGEGRGWVSPAGASSGHPSTVQSAAQAQPPGPSAAPGLRRGDAGRTPRTSGASGAGQLAELVAGGHSPASGGQPRLAGDELGARQQPSRAGRGADRLSERELAVLSYLPTMLTTAEIAAELYVSVNTVKTHLKSIYRKLDVARRRDAVHRARALHLL